MSLGSNLGDRLGYIKEMERGIIAVVKPPVKKSDIMETEPVDVKERQPSYLNRIMVAHYTGTPFELLEHCLKIEISLGRKEKRSKVARTADIDILLFGDTVVKSSKLVIPHSALLKRRFCIEGLEQTCPDCLIPGVGKTVHEIYIKMDQDVRSQKVGFKNRF